MTSISSDWYLFISVSVFLFLLHYFLIEFAVFQKRLAASFVLKA